MLRHKTVAAFALCTSLLSLLPNTVWADEKGEALLREAIQATKKAKSLTADLKGEYILDGKTTKTRGKVSLQRPNFARIEMPGQQGNALFISNGKVLYTVNSAQKQYSKEKAKPTGNDVLGILSGIFFDSDRILKDILNKEKETKITLIGKRVRDSRTYSELEINVKGEDNTGLLLYVGPTKLIEGIIMEQSKEGKLDRMEEFYTNVRVNPKLPSKTFSYKPPATFQSSTPN